MADQLLVPRELAQIIRNVFLPSNPNKMRSAAPEVIEAAKQFIDLLAQPAECEPKPVAWRVTGNRGLTVTSEYPKWATGEGSQGLKVEALVVAHPAPARPAPAEVVLPDPESADVCPYWTDGQQRHAWIQGFKNAAGRLNGVKP